jgi:hypothetical protein
MRRKFAFAFLGMFFVSLICLGCTSVSGNVESSVSFQNPISKDNLIVGSFTYNINDTYIVCPDGSLILEAGAFDKETHEAYHRVGVIGPDGEPKLTEKGKPVTQVVMKDNYHYASYDELYLWAILRATEKAGITQIIAIKSFLTTTSKYIYGVGSIPRQDVTLTIYGEKSREK